MKEKRRKKKEEEYLVLSKNSQTNGLSRAFSPIPVRFRCRQA